MVAFPAETPTRAERLAEAQQEAAQARATAFVAYTPEVCGFRLKPVSLDSFNALDAFQNAFFHGGAIKFEDIANFVWIHHPEFGQFNRAKKTEVTCAVYRYLTPHFSRLNELVWFASVLPRFRWMRHFRRVRSSERQAETIDEIRRLMTEATADMPGGGDSENGDKKPIEFSFQAYLMNTFKRHLGISFEDTRTMPMRQLAEHYREILHHVSNGKALLLTRKEAGIIAEELDELQAAIDATAEKENKR